MTPDTDPPTTAAAYDRWARPYAAVVRRLPVVGRARRRAVRSLDLGAGDRAVDVGCGPGVNLGFLHDAVGPEGTVVGLDASGRMLRLAGRARRPGVALVRGDARRPPLRPPVDGVLSTFVVTLFDDPADVVAAWWDLLAPGGRLALLNMAPVRGPLGPPVNLALSVGLALTTPGRPADDLVGLLDRRVRAAHRELSANADRVVYDEAWNGALRLAVGVKDPSDA